MEDIQRCPCCKVCTDCPGFEKVANVKKAGLIIYRYTATCTQDSNSRNRKPLSPGEILILHNTKNNDITSENVLHEFAQYKKCPRCKYLLEQAEKLLFKIPTINKLDVLGVCNKCRVESRKGVSCCECSKVVKKFIAIKSHKKKETTDWKHKQFKLQQIFNSVINKEKQFKKSYEQSKSESFLGNISRVKSTKQVRQTQVDELFESTTGLQESDVKDNRQGKIRFSDAAQTISFVRKQYSDTELVNLDVEIAHLGSKVKLRKKHSSDESIVYHKAYRKESEDSLRLTSRSQESLILNMHDMLKKTGKSGKYNQLQHLHENEYQEKVGKQKYLETVPKSSTWEFTIEDQSNRERNLYKKKESHKFDDKLTVTPLRRSISLISDIGPGILKAKKDILVSSPRQFHSDEALVSSVPAATDESLRKDFSYFFIKEVEAIKKPIRRMSSSELIKNTQDMLRAREEELKKKKEEELKRKLEEEEKKRIVREEKLRLLNERKRKLEEEQRKKALDNVKLLAEGKEKKVTEKLDKVTDKVSIKEKVSTRTISEKSKKSSAKAEPKVDKTTSLESKKADKEKEKQEKEEKLRLEKERNIKKKEKKEKQKKEKEEQSRKAKEEKEKLKREKEEQSRLEKKKLKNEKEEKDKRKKEREDRQKEMQKEKEKHQKDIENKVSKKEVDKKQTEIPEEKIEPSADNNAKEEAALKLKSLQESEKKIEPEKPTSQKKTEEPKTKELNINQIKIRKPSPDDLILQLVKMKQSQIDKPRERPKRLSELDIPAVVITEHKTEHKNIKLETCVICKDSDLELDIEEIMLNKEDSMQKADIIIGQKIFKYKPPLMEKVEEKKTMPILFTSAFKDDLITIPEKQVVSISPEQLERKPPILTGKYIEQEVPKGVIRYALSDRTFIDKGWTMLPTEKVVRKMNVYRMRPAHPEFDWFEHNKSKKIMHYDSGEKLAEFDNNGRGRWYYRSGRLALDYYDAEEINAQQRFVIHSSGEPDERGRSRPLAILATFDYLGNGIVFDHTGKIRLKYNQTEGVVLDRSIGPVSHWKWHTLNDPPVLQQVMIDTQMAHKDPDILKLGGPADNKTRPDNEEMLAIEFDNFIKEKSKKLSQKFKPFQIKMKALKINEHFSLKVLDQATVYLIYRDGTTNLKLNIGMILDHQEIVDTDTAEVGEVSNSLERFPARTDSLAGLQASVAHAQRVERSRVERERRLRPTQPCSSSDKLTAAIARPLRTPLRTAHSDSTVATGDCRCRCRKPPSNNLYYDTRLV